jgi:predicted nucleic acid-binding protein
MIKVLADTNVILDAIAAREPFRENAEKIFMLAAEEKIEGYITASSATDIYYIARKTLSAADAHTALRYIFCIFNIVDVYSRDCETALDSAIEDFEDALVMGCASKAEVDYIISRDNEFLQAGGETRVISPASFLALI